MSFQRLIFFTIDLDKDEIPKENQYDTILLIAVIEHIFNLKFLFEQIHDLLKDDGKVIITTPSPFGNDFVHKIGTQLGLFDKEGGQDDHIVIFNKKRLQILANEVGLEVNKYQKFQLGCNQLVVLKKVYPWK
ncbi:class I SAM-dependent methyltransferase [Algoriphagus boritolerans]|uniref:class I SAM-dependent methyltransferase n=1 Tax=Algoriphagus boritolerans TaxID=308111 RepID=UPI002FCE430E